MFLFILRKRAFAYVSWYCLRNIDLDLSCSSRHPCPLPSWKQFRPKNDDVPRSNEKTIRFASHETYGFNLSESEFCDGAELRASRCERATEAICSKLCLDTRIIVIKLCRRARRESRRVEVAFPSASEGIWRGEEEGYPFAVCKTRGKK